MLFTNGTFAVNPTELQSMLTFVSKQLQNKTVVDSKKSLEENIQVHSEHWKTFQASLKFKTVTQH